MRTSKLQRPLSPRSIAKRLHWLLSMRWRPVKRMLRLNPMHRSQKLWRRVLRLRTLRRVLRLQALLLRWLLWLLALAVVRVVVLVLSLRVVVAPSNRAFRCCSTCF